MSTKNNVRKVLVVGQTPPPFGGQAIMIARLLAAPLDGITMYHARMSFSKDMDDLKRVRVGKLFHALSLIFTIVCARLRHGIDTLYYPPSGPELRPVVRDIVILGATRWLFRRTVFHFHAAGISEIYPSLPNYLKWLFRRAFKNPDVAIHLSKFNPDDGGFLGAKKQFIIPNGIEDESTAIALNRSQNSDSIKILFVGLVEESKGIWTLLEAAALLKARGLRPKVLVVGRFANEALAERLRNYVIAHDIGDQIEFCGVLTGLAKSEKYATADIFCLPTYFESESFSLVTVEAMSFSIPVIVSRWRGLQSVVVDGQNGFLVEPRDAVQFASRIEQLILLPELRRSMGAAGRRLFEDYYAIDKFRFNMQRSLAA